MDNRNSLYNLLTAWGKYKNVDNDIKNYNRADTVNMSENEMNKFRHIAGPAYLTSQYFSPALVNFYGAIKEGKDLLQGRGLKDTKYDWKNNQKGINIGDANRNIKDNNQKNLFDYIFETEIKPFR